MSKARELWNKLYPTPLSVDRTNVRSIMEIQKQEIIEILTRAAKEHKSLSAILDEITDL